VRATVEGMNRVALIVVVVVAVFAAVFLNVLLLGRVSAGRDPIGKLGPTANLPGQNVAPAPPGVVRPTRGPIDGDGEDD